jgi:hypothetical protein
MNKQRQFLVVCRVGDKSLHQEWIQDMHRNFDLYLSYFGNSSEKYRADAEYYDETKGPKWPILHKIIEANPDLIGSYDAIWFPDDDLSMSTQTICRMFNLFTGLQFELAQPALTIDSYVSHKELIAQPNCLARHTNFVEVMAPIFSQKCLQSLKHTFNESTSGWGLDHLWPVLLNHKNIGVIDCTPVIHTRPVGGELYKNNSMSPRDDIKKLALLYPHLNISTKHKTNKFHIFSTIKIATRNTTIARIAARIQRKINKKLYEKTKRFSEK